MSNQRKSLKEWVSNFWIGVFASLTATGILTVAFWSYVQQSWYFITQPTTIPVVIIFLLPLLGGLFLYGYNKYREHNQRTYRDIRTGDYLNHKWKWDYGQRKQVYSDSIKPICGECGMVMEMFGSSEDSKTILVCNDRDCINGDLREQGLID